jgi:anti-repressor protein
MQNITNQVELFNFESSKIRVTTIDNKPAFCASDVAKVLEYANVHDAIIRHCKGVVKHEGVVKEGQTEQINFIFESDLYRLIMRSKMAKAEQFQDWIVEEVLPTIRRTGQYGNQPTFILPQSYPEALRELAIVVEEKEVLRLQLDIAKPKIEFFDDVVDSKDAKPIGDIAKVLNMGIGRNKLFELLRDRKVLMQGNLPYQNFIDKSWFRVIEQKYQTGYGDTRINFKTLVFQKGLDGIRKIVKESLD